MMQMLRALGLLEGRAVFRLCDGSHAALPLDAPGAHDQHLPDWYEAEAIKRVAQAVLASGQKFTLIDCGADVGLYSRLVIAAARPNIEHIIAFEPNEKIFPLLCENLAVERSGVAAQLFCCGVADFNGYGKLVSPAGDSSSHAFYIERSQTPTDIAVRTIDSLNLPRGGNLMIKLDVEGAEFSALHGAENTLRGAARLVIQLEAHPDVARRTGIEPMRIINHLRSIRPFSVTACVERPVSVHMLTHFDTPLFSQLPPGQIYDLVMVATSQE